MATYVVTGPAVTVTDRAGKLRYYYADALLPGDVSAEQVARLVGRGLVAEVADPLTAVLAEPPTPPTDTAAPDASATAPVATGAGRPERPAQVATKAAWVDYAVARGMDRAKAEAMNKGELLDAFPPE